MPVEDPGGVIEAGPDRQTRVIGGNGTQSLSATLAPGLYQYVESVLVQVDATAAGDVQPELSIATQNGVVIATQQQQDAIPAGDTGSATYALRLADKPSRKLVPDAGFLNFLVRVAGATDDVTVDTRYIPRNRRFSAFEETYVTLPNVRRAVAPNDGIEIRCSMSGQSDYNIAGGLHIQRLDAIAYELAVAAPQLVPKNVGTQLVSFAHSSGAALLNYATPTLPNFAVTGFYGMTLTMRWFRA